MREQFGPGRRLGAALCLALLTLLAACYAGGGSRPTASAAAEDPASIKRGEYLFNAANCVGCHTDTQHGGARLAGGRAVETPFGAYYSRNITPDPTYGIGTWSDEDFLVALRRGVSPAGAHYFPAFPYPAFTGMTDRDILDIKAYIFTQPGVPEPNKPHAVGFPEAPGFPPFTSIRFSALMRLMCEQNGGTFVGLLQ